jgi:hypothetical protein
MSFPGGKIPDHMTDNDVERRIQEEFRIRQQNKNILTASRAYATTGSPPGPSADHAFMNLMTAEGNGASAYYGAAAAAAHQRAAYGGLGQPAFGMDSASMYARQQQQHAHAAAAAAYGYAPRGGAAGHYGAYGHHAPTASDIYSQHMAMTNMEQRAAAYGSVSQQQQQAAHHQLLASSSPQPKLAPSSNSSVVTSPTGTTVPSTESTPLQAHLQSSPTLSEIAPKSSPVSLTGMSGSSMGIPSTPMTTTSSIVPSPRASSAKKGKKSKKEHETTELEDLKIEKWYSGCVPLGLDDDKYWLSELQVYLRANFGE